MTRTNKKPKPPQTTRLTERQQEVFDFIVQFLNEWGIPPTVREIGDAFGIASPNGVICHLAALQRKGYIRRYEGVSRGILVIER